MSKKKYVTVLPRLFGWQKTKLKKILWIIIVYYYSFCPDSVFNLPMNTALVLLFAFLTPLLKSTWNKLLSDHILVRWDAQWQNWWWVRCQIGDGLRGEEMVPQASGPSMLVLEQGFRLNTNQSPKLEKILFNPCRQIIMYD